MFLCSSYGLRSAVSLGGGSGVSLLFLQSQKRLCLSEEVLVFLCSSYGLRSVCVSRSRFWCFFALLTVSEVSVSLGVGSGVSSLFLQSQKRLCLSE